MISSRQHKFAATYCSAFLKVSTPLTKIPQTRSSKCKQKMPEEYALYGNFVIPFDSRLFFIMRCTPTRTRISLWPWKCYILFL